MKKLKLVLAVACTVMFSSCQKDMEIIEDPSQEENLEEQYLPRTKGVPTLSFDWENADWMPTPPGQSRIPSPWIGQGSLGSTFGREVVEDRISADGWELLYSSFDANSPGPINNPYFILYNKYRGLMRTYLYVTTPFVTTSSYLQDGISITSSNGPSTLFNFLGREWIDPTQPSPQSYMQIHPAPSDGSAPLAANKWYMSQHELAFDPALNGAPYQYYQLNLAFNYCNVTKIGLGGTMTGKINGTIGSAASSGNVIDQIKNVGSTAGKGAVAGLGSYAINKWGNSETGENTLGLPNNTFKDIAKGVSTALSGAVSGFPDAAVGLLSAIIGGNSQGPQAVDLTIEADIKLEGTATNNGSLPAMPISLWIPGTQMQPNTPGHIPFYNKPLGVINFIGKPKFEFRYEITNEIWVEKWGTEHDEHFSGIEATIHFPQNIDYSNHLQISPEIKNIADVSVEQELVFSRFARIDNLTGEPLGNRLTSNPDKLVWNNYDQLSFVEERPKNVCDFPEKVRFGVRFIVKIKPRNGAPESTIIKTLEADWVIDGPCGKILPGGATKILRSNTMVRPTVFELKTRPDGGWYVFGNEIAPGHRSRSNAKSEIDNNPKKSFKVMTTNYPSLYMPIYGETLRSDFGVSDIVYRYRNTKPDHTGYDIAFYLYADPAPDRIPIYEIYYEGKKNFAWVGTKKIKYYYYTTENTPSQSNSERTLTNNGIIGYAVK